MAAGVVASAHLLNIIIAKIFSVRSRKTTTSYLYSWSSSVSPPITGLQSETFRNATAPDRLEQLCFSIFRRLLVLLQLEQFCAVAAVALVAVPVIFINVETPAVGTVQDLDQI
jgi:hypothetical protein